MEKLKVEPHPITFNQFPKCDENFTDYLQRGIKNSFKIQNYEKLEAELKQLKEQLKHADSIVRMLAEAEDAEGFNLATEAALSYIATNPNKEGVEGE